MSDIYTIYNLNVTMPMGCRGSIYLVVTGVSIHTQRFLSGIDESHSLICILDRQYGKDGSKNIMLHDWIRLHDLHQNSWCFSLKYQKIQSFSIIMPFRQFFFFFWIWCHLFIYVWRIFCIIKYSLIGSIAKIILK